MLKQIPYFVSVYAAGTGDDRRAILDFIECESREAISSLKNELYAISQGSIPDETLTRVVGGGRKLKHGEFSEWAKWLLQATAGRQA